MFGKFDCHWFIIWQGSHLRFELICNCYFGLRQWHLDPRVEAPIRRLGQEAAAVSANEDVAVASQEPEAHRGGMTSAAAVAAPRVDTMPLAVAVLHREVRRAIKTKSNTVEVAAVRAPGSSERKRRSTRSTRRSTSATKLKKTTQQGPPSRNRTTFLAKVSEDRR